jgi:hypothetical protein
MTDAPDTRRPSMPPGAVRMPRPRRRPGLGRLSAQGHRYRLIETRANGQAAFALCRNDAHASILHANGLLVITLTDSRVSA